MFDSEKRAGLSSDVDDSDSTRPPRVRGHSRRSSVRTNATELPAYHALGHHEASSDAEEQAVGGVKSGSHQRRYWIIGIVIVLCATASIASYFIVRSKNYKEPEIKGPDLKEPDF